MSRKIGKAEIDKNQGPYYLVMALSVSDANKTSIPLGRKSVYL